jgi:hypothetical protein
MTIVVEDGTGLTNANSYCSLVDANTYNLGNVYYSDYWDALDDDVRENHLIKASEYLDIYVDWFGTRVYETSGLRWPRSGVIDLDGNAIDDGIIPVNLAKATAEMAYFLSKEDRFAEPDTKGISQLKVDVIELVFDKTDRKGAFPPNVLALLRSLGSVITDSVSIKLGRS